MTDRLSGVENGPVRSQSVRTLGPVGGDERERTQGVTGTKQETLLRTYGCNRHWLDGAIAFR